MKILNIKKGRKSRRFDKKKLMKLVLTIGIIILAISACMYIGNKNVRDFMNKYILKKDVTENDLAIIPINLEGNKNIYSYYKYITTLENNILSNYTSSGKKESEVKLDINNPMYESNNQFLIVAEKDGNKIALVSGEKIFWEKEIEGNISKIHVNRNGYSAISVTGTTYKTVIIVFDQNGKELFKTYLSNTLVVDLDIANDNKSLAFMELNTTGTVVQSYVKIISIEKAKKSPSDAIEYTYTAETDELIINIKYQDKNKLFMICNNGIKLLEEETVEKVVDFSNKSIKFSDIELNNHYYQIVEETTSLLKTESTVKFKNVVSEKESVYILSGTVKKVYSYGEIIAVNLGSEVYFINTNGWLVKKYTSTQEVQKIVICNNLAGIVYRDKIELINL
ncbi:MAG: DUF5711 family protein [Clostridia bacterium]|nr:DUF5711 family protein [Clostridia bacterium]